MKTTCPHCAVHIDIDPETHAALQGQSHFHCPGCNGLVPVPPMSAASPQAASPAPATILAQAHRGLNRNLLILGSAALLVLGGLGFFLASRGGGIFNSEQKITNEIINNRYFQNLIASGGTTKRDLEAMAIIRTYRDGFIGISLDRLTWEEAAELAKRTGAEILGIEDGSTDSRQLTAWLNAEFTSERGSTLWVRQGGQSRVLDGHDVLSVASSEGSRKAALRWNPGASAHPKALQQIDLLAIVDPKLDRITPGNKRAKANRWEWSNGALRFVADGGCGKIAAPVAIRADSYEIEVTYERLSGNGRLHVDLPTSREKIMPIFLDAPGLPKADGLSSALWPEGMNKSGCAIIRFDRGKNMGDDHISVTVDGRPVFDWNGDIGKEGVPLEQHPGHPDAPITSLFIREDGYLFRSWKLRVFAGEVELLR